MGARIKDGIEVAIVYDYGMKIPVSEIAKSYGIGERTVYDVLERRKVPVDRKPNAFKYSKRKLPKKVVALYKKGWTTTELGTEYNCSGRTITRFLEDNNVALRRAGQRSIAMILRAHGQG